MSKSINLELRLGPQLDEYTPEWPRENLELIIPVECPYCGVTISEISTWGTYPDQSQYSRRIPDQRLQEVLVQIFQTYQHLIPLSRKKIPFTPSLAQLDLLQQGYYPSRMDCTACQLSPARYPYATWGYVATEKKALPSGQLHVVQEGIHGFIANYGPSGGHEHESPIAEVLLNETKEINTWLRKNSIQEHLRPFATFDRAYWKADRFRELDQRDWGWSIPWKKRTLIKAQLEMLEFPTSEIEPLEVLIWAIDSDQPWCRIIGKPDPTVDQVWGWFRVAGSSYLVDWPIKFSIWHISFVGGIPLSLLWLAFRGV